MTPAEPQAAPPSTNQHPNTTKEMNAQLVTTPSNRPNSKFKPKASTRRPSIAGNASGKRIETGHRRKDEQRHGNVATADKQTNKYQIPSIYRKFVEKDQIT